MGWEEGWHVWVVVDLMGSGRFWRACCRLKGRCGVGRDVTTARCRGIVHRQQGAGSPARSPSRRTRKRPGADAGAKAGASTPSPPPPIPSAPSSSAPSRPTSNGGGALATRHGRTRPRPHNGPPHPHYPHLARLRDVPSRPCPSCVRPAAVFSRCSPHGARRGRRAVLLEWTGVGR